MKPHSTSYLEWTSLPISCVWELTFAFCRFWVSSCIHFMILPLRILAHFATFSYYKGYTNNNSRIMIWALVHCASCHHADYVTSQWKKCCNLKKYVWTTFTLIRLWIRPLLLQGQLCSTSIVCSLVIAIPTESHSYKAIHLIVVFCLWCSQKWGVCKIL